MLTLLLPSRSGCLCSGQAKGELHRLWSPLCKLLKQTLAACSPGTEDLSKL